MFDSSAKFPSGVLAGSHYNFGNFDQCLVTVLPIPGQNIKGKYCLAKFQINPSNTDLKKYKILQNYKNNLTIWTKIAVRIRLAIRLSLFCIAITANVG